jgi:predicted PurR-regulated permease PerM
MSNGGPAWLDPQLRLVALTIGIMLIVAGAVVALNLLWPLVRIIVNTTMPFVVGLVFAYIFNPVVTFVQQRLRLSRLGGVIVLYALFLAGIVAFFAMLLPIIIQQVGEAYVGTREFLLRALERNPELRTLSERVMQWLAERGIDVEQVLTDAARSSSVQSAAGTAAASGVKIIGGALTMAYNTATSLIGGVTFLVFAILVNIYLLLDFSDLNDVMEVMVPERYQARTFDILAKIDVAVGGFIRGTLITAVIVGLMTFAFLMMLGLGRYAVLIGVLAGLGNLIPYLGPVMGGGPAMLYVLFSDNFESMNARLMTGAGVVLMVVVVQVVEGFVLQPRIVGKSAQLHPLAVLFALALGANYGLLGMILAVPLACIARVLLKEFYWDAREESWRARTKKPGIGMAVGETAEATPVRIRPGRRRR